MMLAENVVDFQKKRMTVIMAMNKAKYAEIGRKIRALPLEKPDSSYEWEELVQKLCASNDTGLHDIGIRELNNLEIRHAPSVQK